MKIRLILLSLLLSISITSFSQNKHAYSKFIFAMDMLGESDFDNRFFTVFRGVDLDFASNRLGMYLQENGMTYDDDGFKIKNNTITYKFVPKVSTKSEYINITYYYTERKDLLSYNAALIDSDTPCLLIDKVEIVGTIDLVINLYLNYWNLQNIKLGSYKNGEVSYYELMGDYISYIPFGKKLSEITISKGNIEIDYFTNYDIK